MLWLFFLSGFLLAYSNGANDNFKGVATLYGSDTLDFKKSLTLATLSTALGSMVAVFLAGELLQSFTGKSLVPPETVLLPGFSLSVAVGAGITVMIATLLGFPISTTHSLLGALIGVGMIASKTGINFQPLLDGFIYPLLFSPLLALFLTLGAYPLFRWLRVKSTLNEESCLCLEPSKEWLPIQQGASAYTIEKKVPLSLGVEIRIDQKKGCDSTPVLLNSKFIPSKILDGLHVASGALLCFSRALNDTPKIAALFLAAPAVSPEKLHFLVGGGMVLGGIFSARKVAEGMAKKVADLNHGQGFVTNLVSGLVVFFASKGGLPVSTTHVTCGSLFGMGIVNQSAKWDFITRIVLAWIITLPLAMIFGGGSFQLLSFLVN